ncbi:MAG: ACT domain-containing protein [Bryobacterales bacterium]|nr:ACT domain-containing protein [Bryobacterales bacterium]
MGLAFRVCDGRWAVCRLAPDAEIPSWLGTGFVSITRTPHELSIVCPEQGVPAEVQAERAWACLQLQGPFAFTLTGVLASFLAPLAAARVPIFALSTYDTDWVLIPGSRLDDALSALAAAGHLRDTSSTTP